MTTESRWFPGQHGASQRFESGWQLAAGRRWDAEDVEGGVELTGLRLAPSRTLELDFVIDEREPRRFVFADITEFQVDGAFDLGTTAAGWEVMGTAMFVAERERDDGRLVYVLELSNGLVCFASFPAVSSLE